MVVILVELVELGPGCTSIYSRQSFGLALSAFCVQLCWVTEYLYARDSLAAQSSHEARVYQKILSLDLGLHIYLQLSIVIVHESTSALTDHAPVATKPIASNSH